MRNRPRDRLARFAYPLIVLVIGTIPALLRGDEAWTLKSIDPGKIEGAEKCGACHSSEFEVWKNTAHATGFNTLHRKQSAEEISGRMGFDLIKRSSVCLECHYTPEVNARGVVKAMAGVSCESCHGAARDWIDVHNKYGGQGITHSTETHEHRAQRIEQSRAAGMFRPSTVYDVVQNCYRCHTVPNEQLVNRGLHGSGSDFVLVEWLDKINHNYLQSLREGDGTVRRDLTPSEKRVLWVVGWALDLEHSYRGMASATEGGVFLKAMERRASEARRRLEDVRIRFPAPEVDSMLAIATTVPVAPKRGAEQLDAAERIGSQNRRFIAAHDGAGLAPIDTLIAGWRPEEPLETTDPADPLRQDSPDEPQAEGKKVDHVAPVPGHVAIGVTACSKCHGEQAAWWNSDPHAGAASRLTSRRALQIAHYYGISSAAMRSSKALCMDCHAGRGARRLGDGVACEACHGPGKDYEKPHQDIKDLGPASPPYQRALSLGMVDLRRADPMSKACAQCHYITQDRLISSGHSTGANFVLADAHSKIKHWKGTGVAAAALDAAYARTRTERGEIPTVRVVQHSEGRSNGDTQGAGQGGAAVSSLNYSGPDLSLTPFPEIDPNASISEILTILRDRLRELNEAVRKP